MGTILASTLIAKAAEITRDPDYVVFSEAEWLTDLNDSQREVVLHKPEACVLNGPHKLVAGKTKQALPEGGLLLLAVTANLGEDGETPGDSIRIVSREVLNVQVPGWHTEANVAGQIKHYCFDPRDPKTFYVYPKAPDTDWYVELICSSTPQDCAEDDPISLDDIYFNVLLNLMLYRAYSKDARNAQNATLAAAYYQAALGALGVKTQNAASRDPNNTIAV